MGEYSFLFAIAVVFIFGTISPGPSFILVSKIALSKPLSEGFGISIGLSLGAVFFTLLAIFGLYTLFEAVPLLYGTFKVLGGLYLLYLAYKILKHSGESLSVDNMNKHWINNTMDGNDPINAQIIWSIFMPILLWTFPILEEVFRDIFEPKRSCNWLQIMCKDKQKNNGKMKWRKREYIDNENNEHSVDRDKQETVTMSDNHIT